MKNHFIKITVFTVLGVLSTFPGYAQHPVLHLVDPPKGNTNWGSVVNIAQDRQGYIWLANQQGLHRSFRVHIGRGNQQDDR